MQRERELLERFFGAQFTFFEPLREMRFEAGGMRYRLWLLEQDRLVFLNGDAQNPDDAFPAIEIGFRCELIEETEATGIGPVLLFYSTSMKSHDHLRLCITRTRDRRFSISPCLADDAQKGK